MTGEIFSSNKTFRNARELPIDDYIGRVLKEASGYIKKEIKNDNRFKPLLRSTKDTDESYEKREINSTFTSTGIKINSSFNLDELKKIILLINEKMDKPLSTNEKKLFKQLNGIELINKEKYKLLFSDLKIDISKRIQNWKNGDHEALSDIDFYHININEYISSDEFKLCKKHMRDYFDHTFYQPPTFDEIVSLINGINEDIDWTKALDEYQVVSFNDEWPIRTPLIELVHTEFQKKNNKYFLLDKKWYRISDEYLSIIQNRLKDQLVHDKIFFSSTDNIVLTNKWGVIKKTNGENKLEIEANYNKKYANFDNYIIGDKLLQNGIELFDILHYTKDKLYICHIKKGFSGTTRDVCSQVLNSARIIYHEILRGKDQSSILKNTFQTYINYSKKEKHILESKNKLTKLKENGFLNLFYNNEIIYLIGICDLQNKCQTKMDEDDLVNLRSSIMKIEFLRIIPLLYSLKFKIQIEHVLPE